MMRRGTNLEEDKTVEDDGEVLRGGLIVLRDPKESMASEDKVHHHSHLPRGVTCPRHA